MPELPDLEVFSVNLKKRIRDKIIIRAEVFNPRRIDLPDSFRGNLIDTRVADITRNGKELFFILENGNSFAVHLMLHGKFCFCGENEVAATSGRIAGLWFDGPPALVIADFQGLCKITVNPRPPKTPDALSERFTLEYFSACLAKNSRNTIKAALIDQNVVRGIGNAYVDEILWKADISPESLTGKIPEYKIQNLYQAIPLVLNDAIVNITRISPDIISGEERSFLAVHNPRKQRTHQGDRIIQKIVSGKKTYFTEKQKLYV